MSMNNLTRLFIIIIFSLFSSVPSFGHQSNSSKLNVNSLISISANIPSEKPAFDLSNHRNQLPNRVSFPTQLGFVILRRNDIVYLMTDSKNGQVSITYKSNNSFKSENIKLNISQLAMKLNNYPFYKVSRSAIVNLDEIEAYEGTRRDASLVMNDGTKVKLSRTAAGKIHDWIKEMGV